MSIENYGYILDPTDRLFDDECLHHAATDNSWKRCPYPPTCRNQRRRRIQAGEGFRILGLDEYHNGNVSYTTDGNGWLEFDAQGQSPRYWLTYHECSPRKSPINILAIRVPIEQEVKKADTMKEPTTKELERRFSEEMNRGVAKPLYRGQWVSCEVEMPTKNGHYFVNAKGFSQGECFFDGKWKDFDVDYWLKLHTLPPLPAQQEHKDALEKAWENSELQNSMRSELNKEIFRQGWHASRAAMKGENV